LGFTFAIYFGIAIWAERAQLRVFTFAGLGDVSPFSKWDGQPASRLDECSLPLFQWLD